MVRGNNELSCCSDRSEGFQRLRIKGYLILNFFLYKFPLIVQIRKIVELYQFSFFFPPPYHTFVTKYSFCYFALFTIQR